MRRLAAVGIGVPCGGGDRLQLPFEWVEGRINESGLETALELRPVELHRRHAFADFGGWHGALLGGQHVDAASRSASGCAGKRAWLLGTSVTCIMQVTRSNLQHAPQKPGKS